MIKQRILFTWLLFASPMLLAQGVEGYSPYNIGVLYWSMDIPSQIIMRKGLEAAAKELNHEAHEKGNRQITLIPRIAGNGEEGIELQIRQMNELIDRQVDILIVQPTDNAALSVSLKKANQQGIPVVAFDQYISGGKLHSFITSDNYQAGFLDGEYIASLYDNDYIIKIILVDYLRVSSTVLRVDGFLDALAEQQQAYKILSTYEAIDPMEGERVAKNLLRKFPDKGSIDVIFTVNDGGGLSIAKALIAANRYEIKIATVEGDPQSVDYIHEGNVIVIDSAQFSAPMGKEVLLTAVDILHGQQVAEQKIFPVFPVTRDTIYLYPGWQGPIPGKFIKFWKSNQPAWSGDLIVK